MSTLHAPKSHRTVTAKLENEADDSNHPDKTKRTQDEGCAAALDAWHQIHVVREDRDAARGNKAHVKHGPDLSRLCIERFKLPRLSTATLFFSGRVLAQGKTRVDRFGYYI